MSSMSIDKQDENLAPKMNDEMNNKLNDDEKEVNDGTDKPWIWGNDNNNDSNQFTFGITSTRSTTSTTTTTTIQSTISSQINDNNTKPETNGVFQFGPSKSQPTNDFSGFGWSSNIDNNNFNNNNNNDKNKNNQHKNDDNNEASDNNQIKFGASTNTNDNNDNNNNNSSWTFNTTTTTTTTSNSNSSAKSVDNNDNNNNKAWQFGTASGISFGTSNNNDNQTSNDNQFQFGTSNNMSNNMNNNTWSFGTGNDNNNQTSSQPSSGWSFGVTSNNDNTDNKSQNDDSKENKDDKKDSNGWSFVAPKQNDQQSNGQSQFSWNNNNNNNNDNNNNNNNTGFLWGAQSTKDTNPDTTSSPFKFQPNATSNDPFAQFRANNQTNNENDNNNNESEQNTIEPLTEQKAEIKQEETQPSPPAIDDSQIDTEAQAAFLAMFAAQTKDQWCCPACNNYNPNNTNICKACETPRDGNHISQQLKQKDDKNNHTKKLTFGVDKVDKEETDQDKYFKILSDNGELLDYDSVQHPKPRYFPYQYDGYKQDLKDEGSINDEIWNQFDDDSDSDIEIADKEEADEEEEKKKENIYVKSYREYKKRRMIVREKLDSWNREKKGKRIKGDDTIIVIAGDGSMSGQLGVGNGSVTSIPNNTATFPFIMEELMGKKIKLIAAGIMSSAVVTNDDQLYVWGLNDKSELTINPLNADSVDIGDDDDDLSPQIAWNRLYQHYVDRLSKLYRKHKPDNVPKVEGFVMKCKYVKIIMAYKGKEEIKEIAEKNVALIKKYFEDRCHLKKNEKIKCKVEPMINKSAEQMQELYDKICDRYHIEKTEREELFIPKATKNELIQRKEGKLNPYKYLNNNDDDNKPPLIKHDVSMSDYKHSLNKVESENNNIGSDIESGCEDEQKKNKYEEDDFQSSISCSYWTPAHVRLPYKMTIKQVSLGGTHMVVLDNLGQVYSSGTFTNDGPVGHHWNQKSDQVIRYQRTLRRISNIESRDDGLQSSKIGGNNRLPEIKCIASGVNHFLMLDFKGDIWTMGVTKLGQRWCSRNSKKYLCPQRISVVNISHRRRAPKRIKFKKIACGNHHNLAIDSNGDLYSWGQNIWIQCGHSQKNCGYGNVIDAPRLVKFYQTKKDINDENEENVQVSVKLIDVVAGEHMTIALDIDGKVWTCGRNACLALGRKTRWPGYKQHGDTKVKTEVEPDVMRCVNDLKHIKIDWIGCGSVVWFAHNRINGSVYTFGDARNGRAGIGKWRYARGRPVFDEYNLDINKYQVIQCQGGSDHVLFNIKKKHSISRRHSMIGSTSNSRESSVSLDASVVNGVDNIEINNNNDNEDDNKQVIMNENSNNSLSSNGSNSSNNSNQSSKGSRTHSVKPMRRRRKRRRSAMSTTLEQISEENMQVNNENDDDCEPPKKRRKTNNNNNNNNNSNKNKKPPLRKASHTTSQVMRSGSRGRRTSRRKMKK